MSNFFEELEKFRDKLGVNEGNIEKKIKKDIAKIFDFPPLLVLKERYQLGLLQKAKTEWQEAKHTRFEHSVGVVAKCIVASDMINTQTKERFHKKISELERKKDTTTDNEETIKLETQIKKMKEDKNNLHLTVQDVKELAVAAAIHDCGHLPICHASERALLSIGELKTGVSHEERIIPLLLEDDEVFGDIRNFMSGVLGIDEDSLNRIACLISPEQGKKIIGRKMGDEFIWPKRAASQLLSSDLDMDRLDYIMRDAKALKYRPVLQMDSMINFIRGLTFEKSRIIDWEKYPPNNIELCLSSNFLQEAFYLLVARVLLYRYIYFSPQVRSLEGTLTYLLGELLTQKVFLDFMDMTTMSDDYFLNEYLEKRIEEVSDANIKKELERILQLLKKKRVGRYKYCKESSIRVKDIKNPRLRREFRDKLKKSRNYVETLRELIFRSARQKNNNIEKRYLLFDVFYLKTGGGDFLVRDENQNNEEELKTLEDYMNGSNMHRLCTEERLDLYLYTDLHEEIEKQIRESIQRFCEN